MYYMIRAIVLAVFCLGASMLLAQPQVAGARNAGDYSIDLAPGSYVAIFGTGLSTSTASAASLPLPTALGGASVQVGTSSIPLLFVSSGQINAQLPYGISGTVNMTVTVGGRGVRLAPPYPGRQQGAAVRRGGRASSLGQWGLNPHAAPNSPRACSSTHYPKSLIRDSSCG